MTHAITQAEALNALTRMEFQLRMRDGRLPRDVLDAFIRQHAGECVAADSHRINVLVEVIE